MRTSTALFALAGLGAALFLGLAAAVHLGGLVGIDTAIREAVHRLSSPRMTVAASGVTRLGSLGPILVFAAIAVAVLIRAHRRGEAVLLVATLVAALAFENGLKYLFHRPRPAPFFGTDPSSYSFPSGHALFALGFYGMLAILVGRAVQSDAAKAGLWAATSLLVLAIGASRIYLGVHYPSDVLAGYLVAAALVAILLGAERRLQFEKVADRPPERL